MEKDSKDSWIDGIVNWMEKYGIPGGKKAVWGFIIFIIFMLLIYPENC